MDLFQATMIAEGADGYEAETEEEYLEAWQLLVDTGMAWKLQGWFGRTARDLIEAGLVTLPNREGGSDESRETDGEGA